MRDVLQEILDASDKRAKGFVADKVRRAGLARSDNQAGSWQDPEQLEALVHLLLDKGILTMVEIGNWTGHTLGIVAACLDVDCAIGLDVKPRIDRAVLETLPIVSVQGDSIVGAYAVDCILSEYPPDLVLIDGDHSYDAALCDWLNIGHNARVACCFHDVDPRYDAIRQNFGPKTVQDLWKELKEGRRWEEALSNNEMGWGILWT